MISPNPKALKKPGKPRKTAEDIKYEIIGLLAMVLVRGVIGGLIGIGVAFQIIARGRVEDLWLIRLMRR